MVTHPPGTEVTRHSEEPVFGDRGTYSPTEDVKTVPGHSDMAASGPVSEITPGAWSRSLVGRALVAELLP